MIKRATTAAVLAAIMLAGSPARAQEATTQSRVSGIALDFRNQVRQCWSPPPGTADHKTPVVTFDLMLNPDGSVAQPPQLAASSDASDPLAIKAAAAARRAILTCAPYKLPADKYEFWRNITVDFDPRQAGYDIGADTGE